ncbi:alpha/beta hydrolase [Mycolicibacterium diernhoferi]|uniref:Alpha/beta hydrolase n=1 Tax=Mycolicibacterium diernhoferi TaxID=1801 RepID=A0A1Q4H7D0_9MYCO|nr:alpha/beta hydrolase [Mycolicibacterium diernhoferi]OJZ63413.1 esterase [Mycolicibacterium diernhoferi]OPE54985.1 esterase [Mycolicibacterium diernhoferi]PEG54009.1 alpha/beta hydrolase [Mycolicibacterium diernhoferi]QYL20555.1 alpha/beta hydrolase [Mycolicibacterium diernhoferi]
MSLDPQIAAIIESLDAGFPPVHTMTGEQARAVIRSRFVAPDHPEQVASVEDREIAGPDGPVTVRIYRPHAALHGPVPTLVYAHGGGWVFCDLDSHDGLCRDFTNRLPAVLVSVHYRRAAEEGQWPAAAEDVYAAAVWAAAHIDELGNDPDTLLVGGDSAGGNLAAVTALMARDRIGPRLAGQVLLYPVIAADFDTESYRQFGAGFYNPTPALQWYWDQYVPVLADRTNPYASPLSAADLSGLPPAITVVAGHDPLRDEGLAYTAALQAAGVPTVSRFFEGGVHGFMTMPAFDICSRARAQVCSDVAGLVGSDGRFKTGTSAP